MTGNQRLKVLFFLRGIHYDRVFENFLRAMLERGHEVHVALALEKRGFGPEKTRVFEQLRKRYAFSYEKLEQRRDAWLLLAVALRHGIDYLRYLEPEFDGADPLRERARERAPLLLRAVLALPPFRGRMGRRLVGGLVRRIESAVPVPAGIKELIARHGPDVVLVSPLVGLGSIESDYVRAAHELGIPTVLVVASWDNLTNKGVIRDAPTTTIVWNETQVDEAVRLHRIPPDRVVAVGAHSFDHWFTWRPATSREEFARRRRLDPGRPLILYLGSSFFITGNETGFIREWLDRVRSHPRLREVGVSFRPHPQNVVGWKKLDVDEPGKTVVWPRAGEEPRHDRQKAEYFDSLFHAAAVVGVNTTGLIEAAILRRPVLTLVTDQFPAQEGTLHFSYIAHEDGEGLVTLGRTWDEHLDQLADAIEAPETYARRIETFLTEFVRPNGLEREAAPAAVDAVEQSAGAAVEPVLHSRLLRALLVFLTPLFWIWVRLAHPRRTARMLVKAVRRWRRRQRKKASRLLRGRLKARAKGRAADGARPAARKRKEWQAKEKTREKLGAAGGAEHRRARKLAASRPRPPRARARRIARTAAKRTRRLGPLTRRRLKRLKRAVRSLYNMRHRRSYASTIARLPSRDELPVLLNARRLLARGAEIGVKTGKYSDHLLHRWRGRLLISIDPWLSADPDEYLDRSNVSQDEFDRYYQETRKRLAPYGARSKVWRMTSVEAAARVRDESLDFVYIDARHDYESVKEDLAAWLPKVKPGGILAGHDYVDGMLPQGDFGVKSAVDEFFGTRAIPVHSTEGPSAVEQFPSWVVEIPVRDRQATADLRESRTTG